MAPLSTWLIRHGESLSNAGLPAMGNAEVGLTARGFEQSRQVALQIPERPGRLIVSPFLRAGIMADAIRERWPGLQSEVWPIQELSYLSLARCLGTTNATRQHMVKRYWECCDPEYRDDDDAESFTMFMGRLLHFHQRLQALDEHFVTAVGHGQFFGAYLFALKNGFTASPQWMQDYRRAESAHPMRNAEVVRLSALQIDAAVISRTGG